LPSTEPGLQAGSLFMRQGATFLGVEATPTARRREERAARTHAVRPAVGGGAERSALYIIRTGFDITSCWEMATVPASRRAVQPLYKNDRANR
jgi:hypothetical protein